MKPLGIESLFEETTEAEYTVKSLTEASVHAVLSPGLLNESDELRSAVAGQGGLLDSEMHSTRFRSGKCTCEFAERHRVRAS